MPSAAFDFSQLFRSDLPPAAARWTGFPKYNFVGGHNDADSVPVADLVAAANRVIGREGKTLSTYGMQSGSLGYRPLREFIARKLKQDASIQCSADDVLITSGSLQGLDLVNAMLVAPGDTVIVEQMTYAGTITRLNRAGARIIGIPVDAEGMDCDALAAALDRLAAEGVRPKYIYTIPTVQNPTATVMSVARRQRLIALATRHQAPIFEDDCYADLVWTGVRPPAIYSMTNDERVIHIGSFSKSVAPALRIGFLLASWPVMSRILALKGDGGTPALDQMILAEYCEEHFDAHVKVLRKTLRGKAEALMSALREEFGEHAQFDDPAGGIFLWVKMPKQVDTSKLAQVALQAGVALNPGAEWMTDAVAGRQRLRLCFAHPDVDTIRAGVAVLADVCQQEFGLPRREANAHR